MVKARVKVRVKVRAITPGLDITGTEGEERDWGERWGRDGRERERCEGQRDERGGVSLAVIEGLTHVLWGS